jgi:hypothetical protein
MSEMNGTELFSKLKMQKFSGKLVYLPGNSTQKPTEPIFKNVTADGILAKPFRIQEIESILKRFELIIK